MFTRRRNRGSSRRTGRRRGKRSSRQWLARNRLSAQQRAKFAREARQLGMTPNEYMRLLLSLSSTLRQSLRFDADLKPKELLHLVENPLFAAILRWVTQNAMSGLLGTDVNQPAEGEASPQTSSPAPPSAAPGTQPQVPWQLPPDNPPRQPESGIRPTITSPDSKNQPPYWDVW